MFYYYIYIDEPIYYFKGGGHDVVSILRMHTIAYCIIIIYILYNSRVKSKVMRVINYIIIIIPWLLSEWV
jgi:hypothetical protein